VNIKYQVCQYFDSLYDYVYIFVIIVSRVCVARSSIVVSWKHAVNASGRTQNAQITWSQHTNIRRHFGLWNAGEYHELLENCLGIWLVNISWCTALNLL